MSPQISIPAIPCPHCKRKFRTLQALGLHQKVHKMAHAISKHMQTSGVGAKRTSNDDNALGLVGRKRRGQMGMCSPCLESTMFGDRVMSAFVKVYFLRLKQLVAMRRRRGEGEDAGGVDGESSDTGGGSDSLEGEMKNIDMNVIDID